VLDWFCFDFGAIPAMPRKRKNTIAQVDLPEPRNELAEKIKRASEGLWYLSETDAEILPFSGRPASGVTRENLLTQIGRPVETPVEERDFAELFDRLTSPQSWFGEEERAAAERFAELRNLLQKNLRDLRVFKVGKIELDVYIIGLDEKGNLTGIRTKAVET
jgi:hypothetical protein